MSGFGGFGSPFGSPPPQQQQQQQQQPLFGASTTTAPNPFGTGTASFGGALNHMNSNNTPAAAAAAGGPSFFGVSPHVNPSFGGGGGPAAQPTATSGSTFSTPFAAPFGTSSSSSSNNNNNQTMFAAPASYFAAPTPSTFGVSLTTSQQLPSQNHHNHHQHPFGTQQQQQPPLFGTPVSTNNNTTTTISTPFSSSNQNTTTTTTAPLSFGMSNNVMTATTTSFGTTATATASTTFGDLDMTVSPQPYYNYGSGSGNNGEVTIMAAYDQQAAPVFPFGTSSTTPAATYHSLNPSAPVFTPFGKASQQQQQQQQQQLHAPFDEDNNNFDNDDDDEEEDGNDKLIKLKAQIEEKKRRLLEQQQRKKEQQQQQHHTMATTSSPSVSPIPPPQQQQQQLQSLAQRNAVRFQTQATAGAASEQRSTNNKQEESTTTTSSSASSSFQSTRNDRGHSAMPFTTTTSATTTSTGIAATDREDLKNAVSLVGTCMEMCPQEELSRRQAENDIQLLELPQPGILHPKHWTLKNTAVKRFRRSAADYKLDVPEWIRPPDVLENVISYLEEWVMERDRQGVDPRFSNHGNVPIPLDVYQFIWDRTRMIRKDFILQNYVGTGGSCDARAVRCHERIARWHAMCEHQLSHIPDFVRAQSQQNISELGQTLKSLNQFYDDALQRSTVEVPDEMGRETRTNLSGRSHGCQNEQVQGTDPVDYDGRPLVNSANATGRLIGKDAVDSLARGTAEPEMRGMYILLTIDNDGGMEVLKYAGKLYSDRPDVYHSKPVQLAMSVFMARREYNYAKFFSIMKSPETPYLYACLMFKHVEHMRKNAIRIMSKTYGGKTKDNESMYDAYPVKTLARLLCYESVEEAKAACEHYGITVRPAKVRSPSGSSVEEIIYWRNSSFQDPIDEEKGTAIPLPPLKMIRTIEKKLEGATRLAVCRGQVSGEGSSLSVRMDPSTNLQRIQESTEEKERRAAELEAARLQEEKRAQEKALAYQLAQERARETERLAFEEQERQKADELARRQAEEEIQRQREKVARHEAEARAKKEEEERVRQEMEEQARLKAEADARRMAEEIARHEAEAKARQEAAIQAKREAEERARRLAEEQARREADERARRAAEERMRLAAEETRRKREAEELEERQWKERRDNATKTLIFRRWLQRMPQHLLCRDSSEIEKLQSSVIKALERKPDSLVSVTQADEYIQELHLRRSLESCLRTETHIPVAQLVSKEAAFDCAADSHHTFLFTIGILLPSCSAQHERRLYDLVLDWIFSRVGAHADRYTHNGLDIRTVLVDLDVVGQSLLVDAVLVVDLAKNSSRSDVLDTVDKSIPQAVLKLPPRDFQATIDVERILLDDALLVSMQQLTMELWQDVPLAIERFPLSKVCFILADRIVETSSFLERRDDILDHLQLGFGCLVDYLDELGELQRNNQNWPYKGFTVGDSIPSYFGEGEDLPVDWLSGLKMSCTAPSVNQLLADCIGESIHETVQLLLSKAPPGLRDASQQLLQRREFRQALQVAFLWGQEATKGPPYIYVAKGLLGDIIQATMARYNEEVTKILPSMDHPRMHRPQVSFDSVESIILLHEPEALLDDQHIDHDEQNIDHTPDSKHNGKSDASSSNKRTFRPVESPITDWTTDEVLRSPKRTRRQTADKPVPKEVERSRAHTKRLEELLHGKVVDVFVGKQPLSSFLHGAPDVIIP